MDAKCCDPPAFSSLCQSFTSLFLAYPVSCFLAHQSVGHASVCSARLGASLDVVSSRVSSALSSCACSLFSFVTVFCQVQANFERHGIQKTRLDLLPLVGGTTDHLRMYNKVDISLDTFPYAGTTTTCESLIMGVSSSGFCFSCIILSEPSFFVVALLGGFFFLLIDLFTYCSVLVCVCSGMFFLWPCFALLAIDLSTEHFSCYLLCLSRSSHKSVLTSCLALLRSLRCPV